MNRTIYKESVNIAMKHGFDLSDKGIIDAMQLPPVEKWKSDKKLRGFLGLYHNIINKDEDENAKFATLTLLFEAIKPSRSAAIGAIRGGLFEQAVEALARRWGCTVEKGVRMSDVVSESFDHVITLKSGEKLFLMCQIDLWGGGQQTNRADKYLKNDKISIAMVYNYYDGDKKRKGKSAGLLRKAYDSKKMMWLSDLDQLLREDNEKFSRL